MQRFALRHPGETPQRGYLAARAQCGEIVVHATSTGAPMHMHRGSKRCARLAAQVRMPNG